MRHLASTALIMLCVNFMTRADILPPNSKWIAHVAKFENLDAYKDYVFYVYPRDLSRGKAGNSSVRVPESGEVAISGLNPLVARSGVYLYAIPRRLHGDDDRKPDDAWFDGKTEGVLKSVRLVNPIRSVPSSDKRTRIETKYRVEISAGLKITEIVPDAPGKNTGQSDEPSVNLASIQTEPSRSQLPWILGGTFTGLAMGCAIWLAVKKRV